MCQKTPFHALTKFAAEKRIIFEIQDGVNHSALWKLFAVMDA
jgi:hypothetical protein